MAIERWEPWGRYAELQKLFNEMLDEFFGLFNEESRPKLPSYSPSVDMYESEKFLVIRAALPGVLEEDIDVTIEENSIIIRGESTPPLDIIENSHILKEWRYGYFERRVKIPEGFNVKNIALQYTEGVLEIKLAQENSEE